MKSSRLLTLFHDAHVRDLVWAMAAPGLLDHADWVIPDSECLALVTQAMPQLQALDRQPDELHAWIAARNPQRLGRYFETLLGYWLTHLIDARWFVANQIVKSGRIVAGEYDLLWRDAGGQLHHWEAAIKFYLQVDPVAGFAGYVGPMRRDRLDLKTAQLRDKQLQLSQTPAGAATLAEMLHTSDVAGPVLARALLKGWLFYPAHSLPHPSTGLSANHLSGWWMRWAAADFHLPPGLRWRVLDRLAWLSPAMTGDAAALLDEADCIRRLSAHFAIDGVPLLIAGLTHTATGWQEVTRGFVVPPAWNGQEAI
ncbi:hypothetical protein CAP31_04000 [Sulfuriferula sp. AH1]|uniref:DUF1853 family protein n=1 Tax=Sulfuriferula sp. AH1 TaxID=1985873 RepID=UPI000B3B6C1D|nr:DUF1853 family protein [Sulfuriferula sp. AH1]ARU30923.1 hypothetical protein CAP31_04000 [Sulfuriferula sp. AH1]